MSFLIKSIQFLELLSTRAAVQFAAVLFATPKRIPRPPWENELIKKGERIVLRNNLVAYKFGKGPIVLLIHGWEGRGTQLGGFVDSLVDKGYCVYAVDGPGHGESPGWQTNATHYNSFLKGIGYELGPVKAIVAHSFGASSSILAVSEGLETEKLVLIAGLDRYRKVVDNYCTRLGLREKTRKEFFDEVIRRMGVHPDDFQASFFIKKIRVPVLIVHDQDDKAVAYESAPRLHQSLPGSELLTTKGLGHRRILKDPEVIRRVTEFIGS